jgi:hypothetical protein
MGDGCAAASDLFVSKGSWRIRWNSAPQLAVMEKLMVHLSEKEYEARYEHFARMIPVERAWHSIVAIVMQQGARPSLHGTGTLLQIADRHFVITAGHVITGGNSNLFMIPSDSPLKVFFIGEAILADNFDVGVLELRLDEARRIPPDRFLRLNQFSADIGTADSLYAVMGFPQMMFDLENKRVKKFYHVAPGWEGDPNKLCGYDDRFHFHIGAALDETRGPDGSLIDFTYPGVPVSAPFPQELKGISGGPVWKIADTPSDNHTDASQARIVGVECSVFQEPQCIRAVKWGHVINMIAASHPDLLGPIELERL